MKKLILGAALCVVAVACTSQKTSSVSDTAKPTVKSDCCSGANGGCQNKAAADSSGKVCPITGKTMN